MKATQSKVLIVLLTIMVIFLVIGCGGGSNGNNGGPSPTSDPTSGLIENFTVDTAMFFSTYSSKWTAENISSSDISGGIVSGNVASGVLSISATVSKTPHLVNSYSPLSADYSVSAYVKADTTGSAGVLVRWVDKANFYALRVMADGKLNLSNSKVNNATIGTTVAPDCVIPDFDNTKWYKITAKVKTETNGDVTIEGYLNDDDIPLESWTLSDTAKITSAGKAGLYATVNNATSQFKEFKIMSF